MIKKVVDGKIVQVLSEDEEYVVKSLAKIRDIGCVNMFDRLGVAEALICEGYDFEAEYILDNKDIYLELLKISSEY